MAKRCADWGRSPEIPTPPPSRESVDACLLVIRIGLRELVAQLREVVTLGNNPG